jgi:hypothetical protein
MIPGQGHVSVAPVFEFKIVSLLDLLGHGEGCAQEHDPNDFGHDQAILDALARDGWTMCASIGGMKISDLVVEGALDVLPPRIILQRQIGFRVLEMPNIVPTPGLKLT